MPTSFGAPALSLLHASIESALAHRETLHKEVLRIRSEPDPYHIVSEFNPQGTEYIAHLYPSWGTDLLGWRVTAGSAVNDLRSALDHIVHGLVVRNNGTVGRSHKFPTLHNRQKHGFYEYATRKPDRRGSHGPLLGVPDEAITAIERCQPYNGGDWRLLVDLDALWQCAKHREPLPLRVCVQRPELRISGAEGTPRFERHDDGTQIVRITVRSTGPEPEIEVQPKPPLDIEFADGHTVADRLGALITLFVNAFLANPPLAPED
jgi:hypothetical protein